jgi:DNA-binding transcriptional regulator LsrR (DeoR family)
MTSSPSLSPPPPSASFQLSERALAFRAAELFLRDERTAPAVAETLKKEFPASAARLTRETVYPLLAKARGLGFLRLVPPLEEKLAREVENKFGCPKGCVRVVDCPSPQSNDSVSASAADWAVELIKELHGAVGTTIGVGLGPGRATLDFSRAFSQRLREDPSLPKLKLVAISAAGPARYPEYSSISYFNLFPPTSVDQRIGFFAETLVRSQLIKEIKSRPGCREAVEEVKNIHLVVTSMGDMEDEHALLNVWYKECGDAAKPSWWAEAVGDIQYRPYGADRFITDKPNDLRAVTLFELSDMVTLAGAKNRHVILIARQCGLCEPRRTKAIPLRPILKNPAMRVFSRLVLDSPTAYELLQGA